MSSVPPGDIDALISLFRVSNWREMHLQADGIDLFLSKDGTSSPPRVGDSAQPAAAVAPVVPAAMAAQPAAITTPVPPAASVQNGDIVRASSLGTFYRSPKPGAPAFCEVGQRVDADSQLCLIEVMKLFTTVRAGIAGRIAEICVQDGDMVEFDQPLFVIERDG